MADHLSYSAIPGTSPYVTTGTTCPPSTLAEQFGIDPEIPSGQSPSKGHGGYKSAH